MSSRLNSSSKFCHGAMAASQCHMQLELISNSYNSKQELFHDSVDPYRFLSISVGKFGNADNAFEYVYSSSLTIYDSVLFSPVIMKLKSCTVIRYMGWARKWWVKFFRRKGYGSRFVSHIKINDRVSRYWSSVCGNFIIDRNVQRTRRLR